MGFGNYLIMIGIYMLWLAGCCCLSLFLGRERQAHELPACAFLDPGGNPHFLAVDFAGTLVVRVCVFFLAVVLEQDASDVVS